MAIFMERTRVPDVETVAQIQHLLAVRGASSVLINYDQGKVEGLSFQLVVEKTLVPFRLPCRWKSIEKLLHRGGQRRNVKEEDARRIAWRQILRWVEAQLALVETGMVKAEEVFLPYAMVSNTQTMYEAVQEKGYLALPAPREEKAN